MAIRTAAAREYVRPGIALTEPESNSIECVGWFSQTALRAAVAPSTPAR
jgi:hypothetical protein